MFDIKVNKKPLCKFFSGRRAHRMKTEQIREACKLLESRAVQFFTSKEWSFSYGLELQF